MVKSLIFSNIVLFIICISLAYKAFPMQKRKITLIWAIPLLATFLFSIVYPNFVPIVSKSGQNLMIDEANYVSAKIADYFSESDHTKTPTIKDLVDWGGYIPPEKRKSLYNTSFVKESDLMVFIKGKADDEIEIWVIARKGQCPEGNAYVINVVKAEREWLKSYE